MAVGVSNFPTGLDSLTTLVRAISEGSSTLSGSHTSSITTLTCASVAVAPSDGIAVISDGTNFECVTYSGKGSGTLTGVVRGADGTTARSWSSGTAIYFDAVPALKHNVLAAAIIAAQTKLGSGSSTPTLNKVLTGNGTGTSTWADPGLVLLGPPVSVTNVSAMSLQNYFTSDFRFYRVLVAGSIATTNNALLFRFMTASGSITGTSYYSVTNAAAAWGSPVQSYDYPNVGVTYINLGYNTAAANFIPFFYELDIVPEHFSSYSQVLFQGWVNRSGADVMASTGGGMCSGASPKTGIQLLTGSGAATLTAKAHVYGYGGV